MTGPLRGELRPWQLLGEYPDIAFPSDETLRGGRRLNRGAAPMTDREQAERIPMWCRVAHEAWWRISRWPDSERVLGRAAIRDYYRSRRTTR